MKKTILIMMAACLVLLLAGCACKHEQTTIIDSLEPGCVSEGYTGDTKCLECEEIIAKGSAIPATGHTEGELRSVIEATCSYTGYTGDAYCTVCNEQLVFGETVPMTEHIPGELSRAEEVTCTYDGYTGDIYCTWCYAQIQEGEVIPATGHVPGELTGIIEATCTENGYTGDTRCTVCDWLIEGEKTEREPHAYEDGYCTVCGWKVPGLYIAGEMMFTWDEVVANEFVRMKEVDGGFRITDCEDISGELVIDESVVELYYNAFSNTTLSSVWIPATCTEIGGSVFSGSEVLQECVIFSKIEVLPQATFYMCPALTKVTLPETITEIEDDVFLGCKSLAEIDLPDGLVKLGGEAFKYCESIVTIDIPDGVTVLHTATFKDCTALTHIDLPANLLTIGEKCFEGCTALTSIDLPEGFAYVYDYAFRDTGITELVFPSTTQFVLAQGETNSLVTVDMSAVEATTMDSFSMFNNCSSLKTFILPKKMVSIGNYWYKGCKNLTNLVLPDVLMTIDDTSDLDGCESLTEIVWPITLLDGSALDSLPNLATIYYKGSEQQWNSTISKDLFADVEVVFDYVGE